MDNNLLFVPIEKNDLISLINYFLFGAFICFFIVSILYNGKVNRLAKKKEYYRKLYIYYKKQNKNIIIENYTNFRRKLEVDKLEEDKSNRFISNRISKKIKTETSINEDTPINNQKSKLFSSTSEIQNLFDKCVNDKSNSLKREKISKGPKEENIGEERSSNNTAYMTFSQLDIKKDEYDKQKELRKQELDIIKQFHFITNMPYYKAKELCNEYTILPLYNGLTDLRKDNKYCDKVIGVRIKDENFDNLRLIPSDTAIITEIIDIGGVDKYNRGAIKL